MKETPTIKIESGIPFPKGCNSGVGFAIREAMKMMDVGDSFVWKENRKLGREARQVGITVKSRKLNSGGWRVWRIK